MARSRALSSEAHQRSSYGEKMEGKGELNDDIKKD